jgi:hypothetical protein
MGILRDAITLVMNRMFFEARVPCSFTKTV